MSFETPSDNVFESHSLGDCHKWLQPALGHQSRSFLGGHLEEVHLIEELHFGPGHVVRTGFKNVTV